jgi:1-deoxy-D-xylulose 5-phosphate reductoisomerase
LTKAIKLLYIADEKAIKETGVPITWLNYKAWKFGPVPEDIYNKVKLAHNLQKSSPILFNASQFNLVMDFLKPGNILRIPNYQFENGGEPRDKYLIVIDVSEQV